MIPSSASSRFKAPPLAILVVALFGALMLIVTEAANWMLRLSAQRAEVVKAQAVKRPSLHAVFDMESSGTSANLRGIHAVGRGVAWASGANGTVLRTEDSGFVWQTCDMPPGAEKLDFRAIWGWDADNAVVMSSGPGDQSRLYSTVDGCSHWKLLYINPDPSGFWDAMQFRGSGKSNPGSESGDIAGDPVNGRFVLFSLTERGQRVTRDTTDMLPAASGAGAFAASNSSLILAEGDGAASSEWLASGGRVGARIYVKPADSSIGASASTAAPASGSASTMKWVSVPVPLAGGSDSAGIFSLAFRDNLRGMAVGGDYTKPGEATGTAAWTADGGRTWTAATTPPHGYRSAVAWDIRDNLWIAVGANGADISRDDGRTWTSIDDGSWNAISLPWIVGTAGRIAKLLPLNHTPPGRVPPAAAGGL